MICKEEIGLIVLIWYILPAAAALVVLIACFRSGHALRALLGSAIKGVVSLFAVNAAGLLTGVTIAVNPVTLAASSVLGIPGTILLLLLNTIFR